MDANTGHDSNMDMLEEKKKELIETNHIYEPNLYYSKF